MIEIIHTEENIFLYWKKIFALRFLLLHTSPRYINYDTIRAIEKENIILNNVSPKNYVSPDLAKRGLIEVVDLFTNEVKMNGAEMSKDLLGRMYEYCIAHFFAYEGTKDGKFYVPSSIAKTIVAISKPFNNCRVYDFCMRSGIIFTAS